MCIVVWCGVGCVCLCGVCAYVGERVVVCVRVFVWEGSYVRACVRACVRARACVWWYDLNAHQ